MRSEGPHWALGTGTIDPISLAGLTSPKAELLNKRPSNKTVEIANLLTGGPLCIVSSSICKAFRPQNPNARDFRRLLRSRRERPRRRATKQRHELAALHD